jgi:hypothetical protein
LEDLLGRQLTPEALERTKTKPKRVGGQRKEVEFTDSIYITKFRLNYTTYAMLKLHAMQRGIYTSTLIHDILTGWTHRATDFNQELFSKSLPPGAAIPDVPERWYGYLKSIGFDTRNITPDIADIPPPPAPPFEPLSRMEDPAFLPPPTEHVEAAPVIPPEPTPVDPGFEHILDKTAANPNSKLTPEQELGVALGGSGVKLFRSEEHRGSRPGTASAAQRYALGMPVDMHTLVNPEEEVDGP